MLLALALAPSAARAADPPATSILAGSGAVGIDDGPGTAATFVAPAQLTADVRTGKIYVADMGAQRIRAIAPDGGVTTVAGSGALNASGLWVDGGYADGPAKTARFDRPSGIAVGPNGTLYVADAGNHCIRSIAGGAVATYAGSASAAGTDDGPRASARFQDPRGLAIDFDGTLYVADRGVGLRKITPDGTVSTPTFDGITFTRPTGVAIAHTGPFEALFVADGAGLVRITLPEGKAERITAFPTLAQETPFGYAVSSDVPLGVPYAVTALGVGDVAFTDLRDNAVKYARIASVVRSLGATPPENAMLGDGSAESHPMHYAAPMGITSVEGGPIYVADSGNRRIVAIAPFPRRATGSKILEEATSYPKGAYRVAVVGLSYTWWGSLDDDSIGGLLARKLAAVPALASRPPASRSFILDMPGEFDTIDSVLAGGAVDLIVQVIAPSDPLRLGAGAATAAWAPVLHADVVAAGKAAAAGHVPYVIAVIPSSATFAPTESAYLYDAIEATPPTDYDREHASLLAALAGVDVPVFDLYPAARAQFAKRDHRQLFATGDPHFSPYGRDFVAQAISERLAALHPWQK
jgi:hypothetical protein